MTTDFQSALEALPEGAFQGSFGGKKYTVTKQSFANGKSLKLIARELGGSDYISLNYYLLASGAVLKPCEMAEEKVTRFVLNLSPSV